MRKKKVALLAEGVDRNTAAHSAGAWTGVALLAEGVDRNLLGGLLLQQVYVALLAEGVDRNIRDTPERRRCYGRPPRGGRG